MGQAHLPQEITAHHDRRARPDPVRLVKLCVTALIVFTAGCGDIRKGPSSATAPPGRPSAANAGVSHLESQDHLLELRRGLPAPAFMLVDHHGNPFTKASLPGKWTILLFGYTHCPDYCPTTLMTLNNVYRRLEQANANLAGRLQVVFVSVDPFRDTPAILAEYITYFNPRFIGATGLPADLKRFATLLSINYSYTDTASGRFLPDTRQQPAHDYAVNHGASIYVFDDRARFFTQLAPPLTDDRIDSVFELIGEHDGDGR